MSETAKLLGVEQEDYVYRLIRTGALDAKKDARGRWDVDELSVRRRRDRIAYKRSSRSHAADDRARRRAEAAARFDK